MRFRRLLILFLLAVIFLILLSGCQAIQPLTTGIENALHALSTLPDRFAEGIARLLGSISNVGDALAGSIRNIIQNMTGK